MHKKSTNCEPSSSFNKSNIFSQSLSVDANESIEDKQTHLFEQKSTDTLQQSEEADTSTTNDRQNTTVEAFQSELPPVDLQKCDTLSASANDFVDEVQSEGAQNDTVEAANDSITNTSFLSESHDKIERKY